jgi:hypothetical protein
MSEETIKQRFRVFEDERKKKWTNIHNEEQSGRPSVVNDDLVQNLTKKYRLFWKIFPWFSSVSPQKLQKSTSIILRPLSSKFFKNSLYVQNHYTIVLPKERPWIFYRKEMYMNILKLAPVQLSG